MTFGENLKRIRKSRGLTQKELGSMVDIERTTIVKYETDENTKMFSKLKDIATALGCTVGELYGEPRAEQFDVVEVTIKVNGKEVMRWANQ